MNDRWKFGGDLGFRNDGMLIGALAFVGDELEYAGDLKCVRLIRSLETPLFQGR